VGCPPPLPITIAINVSIAIAIAIAIAIVIVIATLAAYALSSPPLLESGVVGARGLVWVQSTSRFIFYLPFTYDFTLHVKSEIQHTENSLATKSLLLEIQPSYCLIFL